MMMIQAERKFSRECLARITSNLSDVVDAMPRWTARIREDDRAALMQALHDLDLCAAQIGECGTLFGLENQSLLRATP